MGEFGATGDGQVAGDFEPDRQVLNGILRKRKDCVVASVANGIPRAHSVHWVMSESCFLGPLLLRTGLGRDGVRDEGRGLWCRFGGA